jgi:hypothetical protein
MYYIIILISSLVFDFNLDLHIIETLLGLIITLIFYILLIIINARDLYLYMTRHYDRYLRYID